MRDDGRMAWWRVKVLVNLVNLSTPLGLLVGTLGRSRFSPGPRGLVLATSYRLGFPVARAFTVGNVVVSRHDRAWLDAHPRLLRHEERHSWQYVVCLGLPMLPLYGVAAVYSLLRARNYASRNPFERLAGLDDGGYSVVPATVRTGTRRASGPGSGSPGDG